MIKPLNINLNINTVNPIGSNWETLCGPGTETEPVPVKEPIPDNPTKEPKLPELDPSEGEPFVPLTPPTPEPDQSPQRSPDPLRKFPIC